MGLEERKIIAAFQRDHLPRLEQSILEAAGFKVELDIDWDAIASQGSRSNPNEWESVYFSPLIEALKTVNTGNDVAKVLQSKVKKVAIICTGKATLSTGSHEPEFKDGKLTIDDRLTNYNQVSTRSGCIQRLLEVIIELTPPKTPKKMVAEEVGKLKSNSIGEILLNLQRAKIHSKNGDDFGMPWLTLSLTSGNCVEGHMLDYHFREQHLLMIDRYAGKLVYARLASIESVTVHLASGFSTEPEREDLVKTKGEVIKVLGNLKINPAKIPGRLQVVRQATSLAKTLSDKIGKELEIFVPWEELPDTENTTISVSLILDSLENVLEENLNDPLAREAINEKVSKVDIQIGERKQVILEHGLLSVFVEIRKGEIDFPTEASLLKMVNQAL